jgi:hypothetical protein
MSNTKSRAETMILKLDDHDEEKEMDFELSWLLS